MMAPYEPTDGRPFPWLPRELRAAMIRRLGWQAVARDTLGHRWTYSFHHGAQVAFQKFYLPQSGLIFARAATAPTDASPEELDAVWRFNAHCAALELEKEGYTLLA